MKGHDEQLRSKNRRLKEKLYEREKELFSYGMQLKEEKEGREEREEQDRQKVTIGLSTEETFETLDEELLEAR